MYKTFVQTMLMLTCLCLAAGCAGSKMKVQVNADERLNQDANRQSLPVVVRLYQLTDDKAFEAAQFHALWKDDAAVLGKDLVSREEVLIQPNQEKTVVLRRLDETHYIAAMALFRDTKHNEWKVIQATNQGWVKNHWNNAWRLSLHDKQIKIAQ